MSTLKTTNISHPNSAANDIVLDANGNVNVDSGTVYVDATNNRVGIGTTSPSQNLHVSAASGTRIQVSHTGGSVDALLGTDSANAFIGTSTNHDFRFITNNGEKARIDSSGRLLVGTPSAFSIGVCQFKESVYLFRASSSTASGQNLGEISFGDSRPGEYARIAAQSDGTPGTGDYPGRLVFSTTSDSASSPTERMRICSTSSNDDILYLNCTGRTNVAPNTTGGRIWQTNGNCKIRTADGAAAYQFYSATGGTSSAVGQILVNASSTSYSTSSDYRLKENVVDLDGAITRVKQLAPKRFNFIANPGNTVDGFLAHEAQAVVPEAVTGTHNEVDDDGNAVMQGIDQSKLVPLLTAALQEAIVKIETLETRLTALEGGTNP